MAGRFRYRWQVTAIEAGSWPRSVAGRVSPTVGARLLGEGRLGRAPVACLGAAGLLLAPGPAAWASFRKRKIAVALVATFSATLSSVMSVRAQNFRGLGFLPGYDSSDAAGVSGWHCPSRQQCFFSGF